MQSGQRGKACGHQIRAGPTRRSWADSRYAAASRRPGTARRARSSRILLGILALDQNLFRTAVVGRLGIKVVSALGVGLVDNRLAVGRPCRRQVAEGIERQARLSAAG